MKYKALILIVSILLVLQGCASGGELPGTQPDPTESQAAVTDTSGASEGPSVQASKEAALVLPITENTTGKTLIQTVSASSVYLYTSYIISSANGENIVIDPTDMPPASVVELSPAAIISSHSHPDHVDPKFTGRYDCPKLLYEEGQISTNDFAIDSILSSHSNDKITEFSGNHIIIIEADGLRIAYMGDIGQTFLTDEQLEKLGHIDIAFMQFENSYSQMSLENEKGFKLIEQLNPVIVIPTHYSDNALQVLEEKYGPLTEVDNCLEILKEDLPEGTLNVYRILNNHIYK